MAKRWPPILGFTGFDGGTKPAIALATRRSLISEPEFEQTGACCYDDGTCIVQTQSACAGVYQGDGTPCDPNPCCPDSATVTFHDVLIDCGCQVIGGDSVIVTEVGFNGVPITLTRNTSCGTISGFCHLVGSTTTSFHHKVWTNTHCTGSPIINEDTGSTFDLVLLSGTWYLLSSSGQFVFYATSSSMTGPFTNTVVCDPVCCSTWFVPFCPPGHNSSFSGVAHGGYAVVTVP